MSMIRALRSLTLRTYLMLLVLLVLLPAAGLLIHSAIAQRRLAAVDARREALRLARIADLEQSQLVTRTRELLLSVSQLLVPRSGVTFDGCSPLLARLLASQPFYLNIGIASTNGRVLCSAVPLTGPVTIADRAYFRRALKTGSFSVGNYQIGRITGKGSVNFAAPVASPRGNARWVAFAAVDLNWIHRMLANVRLLPGSSITVVDPGGTVLGREPDPGGRVGQSIAALPLMAILKHSSHAGTTELRDQDGVTHLYGYAPLDVGAHSDMYLVASIPGPIAFAAANSMFSRNLALFAVVALAALAAAWIGADTLILRRARAISTAAGRLAQGDMSARTGLSHDDGDFGQVAYALDDLAEKLQHHEDKLDAANRELSRINRALLTLGSGNRTLVRAIDEQSLIEGMCRLIVETGGYRLAWVGYAEHDSGKSIRPAAQAGFDEGYLDSLKLTWADTERGRGPSGTAIRTGAPCLVHDVLTDARFGPWRQDALKRGYRACICLPIRLRGKVIGALNIYSAESDAFMRKEVDLLTELADDLAFGIATVRMRAESQKAHETIWRMAYYDEVTGLPNHARLTEFLQQMLADANAAGDTASFSLLILDIDRFREINDAVGIENANALLMEIGLRIRNALPEHEMVARMRGDEFAALLPETSLDHAVRTAHRILEIMQQPFTTGDLSLDVRVSIGIAQFPQHGDQIDLLLRRADLAVRRAKGSDSGYAIYEQELDDDSPRRLALASDLRRAIDTELLQQHYQPKIDMKTGQLCGVEALARWHSLQYGTIAPSEFIPLAEHTGLIRPLTYNAIEAAMRQLRTWSETGLKFPVAVNLSARNLRDPALVNRIRSLIGDYGIDCGQLELEITESAIMEDPDGALDVLTRLSEMGIALSIDDFGTGYSSLSYLNNLPVNAIKIDKSFVIDMLSNEDAALIVRSTIVLAHDLGLRVIAEGIESKASWQRLAELGCDVAQGYYVARPMHASDLDQWIHSHCRTGIWIGNDYAA